MDWIFVAIPSLSLGLFLAWAAWDYKNNYKS